MKCWLNGDIVNLEDARISPFDRGFLLGDGVYETVQFFNRTGVGMELHVQRLERSMEASEIRGFEASEMVAISEELLDAIPSRDGIVYLQVTRGVQIPRRHLPQPGIRPTVFAYALPTPPLAEFRGPGSAACITREDDRWLRCAIKSTSLLANVLGQIECESHRATEAILHRSGFITEGTMTNVFLIKGDELATPPIGELPSILAGVTRHLILECAEEAGLTPRVREIGVDEAVNADEVMITSSRRLIDGVTSIDGASMGDGAVGPATRRVFEALRRRIADECGVRLAAVHA